MKIYKLKSWIYTKRKEIKYVCDKERFFFDFESAMESYKIEKERLIHENSFIRNGYANLAVFECVGEKGEIYTGNIVKEYRNSKELVFESK